MKAYRVENPILKHGIWRDFDGVINPIFSKLTVGKCKDMLMEDSDFYRFNGKAWFSATDEPEKLKAWFDVVDIIEMEKLGYRVYVFDVDEYRTVSPYEIVFTRESILSVSEIDPKTIWGYEYEEIKTRGN